MTSVHSKDGTKIVFKKSGSGPAIILIDGAFCSKDFGPMVKLAPALAKHFTVFSYDRRARGQSSDTQPYAVQREIEDLEALIKEAGGSAAVFAVSSGAILALQAAAGGAAIDRMALLEPPFVGNEKGRRPKDGFQQLTQLIAAGNRAAACRFYLRKIIGVPAIVPFFLSLTNNWPQMKANADSLPYDAALCHDFTIPKALLQRVKIPTVVIDSTKSPRTLRLPVKKVAELLPKGKHLSFNGSVHSIPPKLLVPALVTFCME